VGAFPSNVTDVKRTLSLNAKFAIVSTDFGITTDVKPVFKKAASLIVFNAEPASNVTDVKAVVARENGPIKVTDFGIKIDVKPDPSKAFHEIVSNSEFSANSTDVKSLLSLKASGPIDVTVDGILAVPVQVEPALTTLSVIVNDPATEQSIAVVVAHAGVAGTLAVTPATTANTIRLRTVDVNRRGDALTLTTTLRSWPRKEDFDMPGSSGSYVRSTMCDPRPGRTTRRCPNIIATSG
jgi:hypothetical protein